MGQSATRARSSNGGSDKYAIHTADCYVPVRAARLSKHAVHPVHPDDDGGGAEPRYDDCAVCWDRLEWVAIGTCGHPSVCAECTVRLRFAHGDRRCCICRKHCDTVVVTKGGGRGVYARMLAGRPAVDCRGFWYHYGSTTYFEDKGQYKAARKACADNWPMPKYCPKHHRRPIPRRLLFWVYLASS